MPTDDASHAVTQPTRKNVKREGYDTFSSNV